MQLIQENLGSHIALVQTPIAVKVQYWRWDTEVIHGPQKNTTPLLVSRKRSEAKPSIAKRQWMISLLGVKIPAQHARLVRIRALDLKTADRSIGYASGLPTLTSRYKKYQYVRT